MTSLLDILKETDFRVDFTRYFKSSASRETLDRETLRKRLLLCLYGLGTNTGLKRVSAGDHGEGYNDLLYVRSRFLHKEHLREAIAEVANAVFRSRQLQIWGEATTTCASDSKKFGAYDQNLMTEWHARYGGRGGHGVLARRKALSLYLLAAQDLFVIRSGSDDRRGPAALHRHDGEAAIRRLSWAKRSCVCLLFAPWLSVDATAQTYSRPKAVPSTER